MKYWTITYVDGSSESTPPEVDYLRVSGGGVIGEVSGLLYGMVRRTHGRDEVRVTYVLANVKKWESSE